MEGNPPGSIMQPCHGDSGHQRKGSFLEKTASQQTLSFCNTVHIAVPHDEIPESVTLDKTKAINIIKLVLVWLLVVDLSKVISRCFDSQMNGEFLLLFF